MLDEVGGELGELGVGDGGLVAVFAGEAKCGGGGGGGNAVDFGEQVVGFVELELTEVVVGLKEAGLGILGVEGEGGFEGGVGLLEAVLVFVLAGEFEVVGCDGEGGLLDVLVFLLELIEGVEGELFAVADGAEAEGEGGGDDEEGEE